MIYGLTPQGFRAKRLPEIKAELEASLVERFGQIDLRAESIFGQLVGIDSADDAVLWALAEMVYNSQYPDTASGVSLDYAVALNGITRQPATFTTATAIAYGLHNTVLAQGRQVSNGADTYQSTQTITISRANAVYTRTIVNSVGAGDYTLTINGVAYTYTAGGGDDETDILTGLQSALVGAPVTVSVTTVIELTGQHSLTVSANLTNNLVGTNMPVRADDSGAKTLLINTLTQIITPVAGWQSVNNPDMGITGRDRERDEELLARRNESIQIGASTTTGAIVGAVRQVIGVVDAVNFPNNGTVTDANGTERQHVWVIVEGGDDNDIAEALYSKVAAGIGYRGAVSVLVTDPITEQEFAVKFDRPTTVYPLIDIDVSLGSGAPANIQDVIKQALADINLRIGETLFYSRLFCPVNNIAGVIVQDIEVNAEKLNIVPDPDERIIILPANVTVTIV